MKKHFQNLCFCAAFLLVSALAFSSAAVSMAQTVSPPLNTNVTTPPSNTNVTTPGTTQTFPALQNPITVNNVQDLLSTIIDLAIFIGTILAVLMFIWIGFKFVLAQGDSKKLQEARNWFFYAVIGTAILISARVIVDVVKNTAISAGVVNQNLFNKPQ